MFDLDKEIQAWCRSIYSTAWKRASSIDELKDHLHCEIEQLSEEGLTDEQAFLAATEVIGNVEDLRKEHAKNRSLLSSFSGFSKAYSRIPSGGPDMSKTNARATRPLLPTFISAIGMLIGGLLGAASAMFGSNETVVIACYTSGFIGGAVVGAIVGGRWQARRERNAAQSQT